MADRRLPLIERKQKLHDCLRLLLASTLMMVPAFGAAGQPGSAASSLALFRAVCMGGGSSLKKSEAKALPFDTLPANAKKALEYTSLTQYTPATTVANTVYKVGGGEGVYLLLPRSGSPRGVDPYSSSCAVIWHGQDYLEAKRMIMPHPDPKWLKGTLPSQNGMGFAHSATDDGDLHLSVAAYSGWTALRSAPSIRTIMEAGASGDPRR